MTGGAQDRRKVLILSQRGLTRSPAYSSLFEFEDFILSVEDSRLIELEATLGHWRFDLGRYSYKALRKIGASESSARRMAPNLITATTGETFDFAVAVLRHWYDLYSLTQIAGLLDLPLLCWVSEIWPSDLETKAFGLEPVGGLDRIFVGTRAAVAPLADKLSRDVIYLPHGVDTVAFAADRQSRRTVGVTNIGRRDPDIDAALARDSKSNGWRYETNTGEGRDHAENRQLLSSLLGSSETFLVNHAKFDLPHVIGSHRDVPGRFFEAIASGAVPIGSLGLLDEEFDGKEACIGVESSDPDGIIGGLERLLADPYEAAARRAIGYEAAARSHDWAHRWNSMLDSICLRPTVALKTRLDELSGRHPNVGRRIA